MLALGEEHGDDPRFRSTVFPTLLDQLIAESDSTTTDAATEARRASSATSSGSCCATLLPGFTGELRPHQKFGYDWLHFPAPSGWPSASPG